MSLVSGRLVLERPSVKEFKEATRGILERQVHWARAHFRLPDLDPRLVVHGRTRGPMGEVTSSYVPRLEQVLEIAHHPFVNHDPLGCSEYPHYAGEPEIGGFTSQDWTLLLEALVAHEVAHVVQAALRLEAHLDPNHPLVSHWDDARPVFGDLGTYEKFHGGFFQSILLRLRREFVTHRVLDWTVPSGDFNPYTVESLATQAPTGLEGMVVDLKGGPHVVVGRNPLPNRLYGYMVRGETGDDLWQIRLLTLVQRGRDAEQRIGSSTTLPEELRLHREALQRQRATNAKISATKRAKRLDTTPASNMVEP